MISRAPLFPQINAQAQMSSSNIGTFGRTTSNLNANVIGITAQEQVFDFGKSWMRGFSGNAQLKAALADSQTIVQQLIFSTVNSYFLYAQARAVEQVNVQTFDLALKHLAQAQALYEAGKGIRYAVVRAAVDTSNARLSILRSHNTAIINKLNLENVIGQSINDSVILIDSSVTIDTALTLDSLLQFARAHRTELSAAHLRTESARYQLRASQLSYFPSLSVGASAGYHAPQLTGKWTENITGSVTLAVPLFTGGSLTGSYYQMQGNYYQAQSSEKTIEQSVLLDIQQQQAGINEACERLVLATKTIEQAALALSLARERFTSGIGTGIEVSDAESSLANSQVAQIQARYDLALASLRYKRAIGTLDEVSK